MVSEFSYVSNRTKHLKVLRLKIILQPKASKDQIVGLHDDELKITITAPPVDGQANAHLLKFLSKAFKVPKSSIVLEKGELNRHKQVWIPSPKLIPSEIQISYKISKKSPHFLPIFPVLRYPISHFTNSKTMPQSAVKNLR